MKHLASTRVKADVELVTTASNTLTPHTQNSCLNIMRRLPPSSIEQNLSGLLNLVPSITDELLQRVDQPLETSECAKTKKGFLMCDYNRDGDSYRSPWSNEYYPALDDGFKVRKGVYTLVLCVYV